MITFVYIYVCNCGQSCTSDCRFLTAN